MRIDGLLYFDHQATTPLDARVLADMVPYFGEYFGNPHSSDHAVGWKAAAEIERAAAEIAVLVGADTDEVIFTSGATEANNLAVTGIGLRALEAGRNRIFVSAIEHKSTLACARYLHDKHGFRIQTIPVDGDGLIDLGFVARELADDVLLVSVMAVNNEIGTIQPVAELSALTSHYGTLLHCDAAQAPGAISLKELALHADMISLSAHKMYGPAGIGALIARREMQGRIEPIIHGGGQQNGLRSGTLPLPLCVGLGSAARLIMEPTHPREIEQIRQFRDRLIAVLVERLPGVRINGAKGHLRHPGNANLLFEKVNAQDLLSALQPSLAASTGSACTSGIPEPSHVLRSIGLSGQDAESSVRFSIGRHTTAQDIEDATAEIVDAVKKLRKSGLAQSAESESRLSPRPLRIRDRSVPSVR
jgi:cysteine desulfurase